MATYKTITPQQLIEKFQYALDNKWGYIWGGAGGVWTQAKQDATTNEEAIKYGQKWVGHRVADCSGLLSWAFKQLGSYMYHGSNTMWNKYCNAKGELKNGVRADGQELKPGTAVFVHKTNPENRSHVGLYIGGDTVIEANCTPKGVITSKITNKKWTEWGELKYVDYGAEPQPTPTPEPVPVTRLLRYGCKGEDVKYVQWLLNEAGYLTGGIDGIFGQNTLAAVKGFQGSRGLKVDGIVGPLTLEALQKVGPTEPKYKAVIENLTKEEADAVKAAYPSATIMEVN